VCQCDLPGCGGPLAGKCEECTCPPGKHKVGCAGQDAGACQDCAANTFATSVGTRVDGCAPCVTCSAGKFLDGCIATAGPGTCEECPRGQFLEGGTCRSCCPARGYRDPDVDCRNVSLVLASGAIARLEELWANRPASGALRWKFATQGGARSAEGRASARTSAKGANASKGIVGVSR